MAVPAAPPGASASGGSDGEVVLTLAARPPFDGAGVLAYLAARAVPGVESVDPEAGVYRRTVVRDGGGAVVTLRPDAKRAGLHLRLPATGGPALADAVARARRLFDLDADPARIAATLERDPLLASRLRARPGLRVPGAWSGFELAVRAILGQQISVAGATTLAGRLVERLGQPVLGAGTGLDRLFPTPAVLADADLAGVGLPAQRARALRALAEAVADGSLDLDAPPAARERDREARLATLASLPGVGPWTSAYVALRALRDPDALPASDLGLRRALAPAGAPPLSAADVARRAEAWRPWRGYGALALWMGPPSPGLRSAS